MEITDSVSQKVQIVIIELKEPPQEVASALNYQRFAGNEAIPGDRTGFVPESGAG